MKHVILLVLFVFATTIQADINDDDDFDGVTVEEENDKTNEIPYVSPTPSNKHSVYLAEHFDDPKQFETKWIRSEAKKDGISDEISKYDGIWQIESALKDALIGDLGLVLKSKAKHAAIATKLDKPFQFNTKPLIIQYEVTLQDGQECGGAYLKLLSDDPDSSDLKLFHDKTPYTIMFGPDKCGNDHKLHFIFRHRNPLNGTLEEKHCNKPKDRLDDSFKDKLPHLYSLIVRPDNSFEIWLDRQVINSGSLLEDFTPAVNPPAEIDDPNDKKPVEWDEREKIPDPDATKPDDWDEDAPATIVDANALKPDGWLDDEPTMIADPEAKQPDDWDQDMDGEWEAPLIDNPKCVDAVGCGKWEAPVISNPAYKGKWRPPLIDNPNYKGKWSPRRVSNPDFFEDTQPFKMHTISAIGFELWSMSQDILFDNIIVTDDISVASDWAASTFELKRKKIAKDSVKLWSRMLKAMNYKPGWWLLYLIYCAIPIVSYIWYLRKRVFQESFIQRMLMYADEYPWLWIVYVVTVGLPIVLIVYCCCKSSDKQEKQDDEKEEYDAANVKKTDAYTKDDDNEPQAEKRESGHGDDKTITPVEEKEDEEEEEEEGNNDNADEKEEMIPEPSTIGDVARKRKVRKE